MNNFALSNADVMTALKNSSASMAAANATFEETVALITAGQEIAQDSSKVGNALRTISMRIRGMNEETEEFDGTLQTISGDVYDLTNGKVSIMLDPETYKSPYKILQDISKVWGELTDVQQAGLAEKLFGKNRANIGIAIIENFEQAEAAMNAMSNSAGAADKEMEIITNSLSYKMNALRETGTGIWQNIFQRESVGGVVDDLNVLLGIIEKFTDKVGLLGTVLAAAGIGSALIQFAKTSKMLATMGQSTKFLDVLRNAFPSVNNAILAYQVALKNGSSAMVAFGAGAKAMITSITPLIGVLIAIGVALAAFHAFEEANTGWTRAQESAQKAITDYQEAKEKLESLNKEKTDNLSKVQEIAAKYDIDVSGMDDVDAIIEKIKSSDKGITLVDQVELDKLSTANKQLDTQMKIQEQIERAKKQGALLETEIASKTEKSYWEEVRDKHGKGLFGTIAAGWEYINTRGGGAAADENGNPVDVGDSEGEKWAKRDTTNIGMATTAYNELIAKKQELKTLEEEMANSPDAVSQEQIDRREQLTNEIAEQGSKTATLIRTVSDEMENMKEGTSEYSKDYVERASKLVRDFANIDASPAEAALNNLNAFFDGTSGKNAIKEQLIEAAKSGEDLESTLRGLGLSLEDLDISDASYLNDYFADLAKEVEKADEEVTNFGKTVEDVEAASKTEDADSDWKKIQAAYKKAGEYYEEGKTGIDDFKSVAQFMSSKNLGELAKQAKDAGGYAADVYQEAFENARAKADRWFGDDEAQSLMNFADDAESSGLFNINKNDEKGLWDISVAEGFENTAQAADKLGTSVGVVETMLSGLEAYGYDFDGIEKSGEMFAEYSQTLDALKQTYDSMAEGAGKERLDKLLFGDGNKENGEEGFLADFETFKGDLSELSKEQVIRIKFEYDLASIQTEIDYLQNLIDNGMDDDVGTRAQLLAEQDRYNATAERGLGLDQDKVLLPVEYELSKESESDLKEQLKNATDKDDKLELQAEIENEQQVQKDILETFADAHPEITPETSVEDINKALQETFGKNTIEFDASVDGVESKVQAIQNEDGTIDYHANVDGVEQEVEPVKDEEGQISFTEKVEKELDKDDLEKEGELKLKTTVDDSNVEKEKSATMKVSVDSSAADSYQAKDKQAKVVLSLDSKAIDGYKPPDKHAKVIFAKDSNIPDSYKPSDKHATVIFGKDSSSPDGYSPSNKSATVVYTANTSSLPTSFSTITRYVNYVKTGDVGVDGTAHVNGTAYARGTAFARGDWGTKSSGTALVGELGTELLVRDGRFQTIGDNGAEFVSYKKGDIIFNAEQTKQILEKGKITHGKRRGRALAEGTAFRFGSGSSGSSSSKSSSKKSSSDKKKKKKKSSSGDDDSKKKKSSNKDNSDSKDKQQIDWIEIAIKRAERAVKNLKEAANNAYDSFRNRNLALSKDISAVTSEINLQKRAWGGYQNALNKVGLDSKLAKKVQNGSIEVTKYDSGTQKKIKEYQDLYEKMLKTADAAQELKRTLSELYKQRFDTVAKRWDNQTEDIKFTYDRRESDISRRSDKYNSRYGKYGRLSASEENIRDYNRQIGNIEKQRDKQNRKAIDLQKILDKSVSSGAIKKGSEQYYDMLNEIRSAQKEVDKLNEDIIDNTNKIAEEYINMFDIIQENWDNSISNLQHNYDHIENLIDRRTEKSSEYVSIDTGINSSKKNITEYGKLIKNENTQLSRRRSELTELQKTLNKALKSGEIKKGSEDYYDMLSKIRDVREEIDDLNSDIVSNTNNIAKEYVNVFEKIETKYENLLEPLNREADSTSSKIEKRNANTNDYNSKSIVSASAEKNIDDYKELNRIANDQIKIKKDEIKALQTQLDNAVKKGAITKSSEQYQKMLSTIQGKQKDVDDMNISIINNTKSIAEEYKKMFDEIASNASNSAAVLDHYTKGYNTQMDIATAKGYATSANYYAKLKAIEEMNAKDSKKLAEDLQKQLNEAVQTGAIKLYSQAWYDMTNQIRKAKEETNSATASMLKYANQIQKVNWDRFDYLNDRLSEIRDESKFLIDLMSDEKLFDDAGKVTEYGMATIGLHAMNYDSYLNQVRRYANELSSINEQLAKDPNNTTLIDRRKELLETQRDLILASQDEKESIKDLVEDGLDKEIDALDDLIDKYLDALDSQKDLYDYQKKVANQTDEIASIQKQLSAYSGDNSSESLAKIQKLNEDLKKAEEDLRETEYDKYVSDSKKMLSDLKDEFEQRMNDRLDNIDGLIAELSGDVDNNKESICKTLEEQASDVGYTLTSSMESVWSSASDVLSSTNQTLSDISDSVRMIWAAADKLAQTSTKSVVDEANKSKYTGTVNVNGKQFYYSGGQKQVGWQTVGGNKRYYNTKDGDAFKGFHKIGSATYYFDPKTGNLRTGTFTVDNMSYQTDKNGKILKKAKKGTNQWKKYASGSRRISHDQFGWTNESGQEMLYRNGSGAILTPLGTGDKVFSNSMADTLWNISKPGGIEQIIRGITHGTGSISAESYRSILNAIGTGTSVNQNFENITFSLPNVKDYDSLVRQMQSDNKFEKLIQSMTIGRLNGKSKNDKKRIIF